MFSSMTWMFSLLLRLSDLRSTVGKSELNDYDVITASRQSAVPALSDVMSVNVLPSNSEVKPTHTLVLLAPSPTSWLHVWLSVCLIDGSSEAYWRAVTGRDPRRRMCYHVSHLITDAVRDETSFWGRGRDEGATETPEKGRERCILGFYFRILWTGSKSKGFFLANKLNTDIN